MIPAFLVYMPTWSICTSAFLMALVEITDSKAFESSVTVLIVPQLVAAVGHL
jgi:hypothetical protein